MKKTPLHLSVVLISVTAIVLGLAGTSSAVLTNGGFEAGFNGWLIIGNTSIVDSSFGSGPTGGAYQALLTTGSGAVSDNHGDPNTPLPQDTLEGFLGLPFGSLDGLITGLAIEGSAIKQTFFAYAGDVISFHWNFLTNEYTPAGEDWNDSAFVFLIDASDQMDPILLIFELLADTYFEPFLLSPTPFYEETGFFTHDPFTYTIMADGSYTLGIGVVDAGDPSVDSGLLVDNVTIMPADPISVPIDIKPGSCPNPLNVKRNGVISVAILGTEDFDVTTIDPITIRLEGTTPIRSNVEDVSTPVMDGEGVCDCTDEGPDGYDDMTFKFDTQEIVRVLGDVNDGDVLPLTLTGNLKEEYGGTPIVGQDCVRINLDGK